MNIRYSGFNLSLRELPKREPIGEHIEFWDLTNAGFVAVRPIRKGNSEVEDGKDIYARIICSASGVTLKLDSESRKTGAETR